MIPEVVKVGKFFTLLTDPKSCLTHISKYFAIIHLLKYFALFTFYVTISIYLKPFLVSKSDILCFPVVTLTLT